MKKPQNPQTQDAIKRAREMFKKVQEKQKKPKPDIGTPDSPNYRIPENPNKRPPLPPKATPPQAQPMPTPEYRIPGTPRAPLPPKKPQPKPAIPTPPLKRSPEIPGMRRPFPETTVTDDSGIMGRLGPDGRFRSVSESPLTPKVPGKKPYKIK